MNRVLTSEELRIAARQAITLALTMIDSDARNDLLLRAQRLFDEARQSAATDRPATVIALSTLSHRPVTARS